MLGFNGGTIGIANTVFTGTKSDDPNYSSVSLLLHGDGTNGSTTFIDSSSNSHTVTPFANAQISTTQSKFGGASMYFDGSGDYIDCGTDSSYDMGSGDFTIEGWFYYLGTNNLYPCIITNNPGSWTTGAVIFHIDHTSLQDKISFWAFDHSSSSPIVANTTSIIYNQWHHFAIVRSGTVVRLAYNGQIEATATISASLEFKFNLPSIRIGGGNWSGFNGDFNGYIDDLRITKGVARYTSNLTPPTAQLPGGETGTFASGLWTSSDHIKQIRNELWPGFVPSIVTDGLVLHLDAGDSASYPGSGTTWTDLSGNGNNGTINGATYDSANGGSLSFDGVNDYISTPVAGTFSQITFEFMGFFDDPTLNTLSREESAFGDWTNSRVHFGTRWTGSNAGMHFNVNNVWNTTPATNLRYGWNHYLLVYDTVNDLKRVYLNNILSSSVGTNGNMTIGDFRIGVATNLNRYYRGNIANFKIYNRALTQSEITQNYNALKGRYGL